MKWTELSGRELQANEIKHFGFLKELEKRDGVLLPAKMVERMKAEYQTTMVMVNDSPFRNKNDYFVKVYVRHCFSKPIFVYVTKEAWNFYHQE